MDFPLRNFSLEPILSRKRQAAFGEQDNPTYELYATVNHFGVAHGGHYTAACKYDDERWYTKDDSQSKGIAESDVSGPSAYILFFRRQNG